MRGGTQPFARIQPKQVSVYSDAEGYEPFTQWLQSLRDVQGRQRILVRIGRMEQGNYGDYAVVGNGVSELRLFFWSWLSRLLRRGWRYVGCVALWWR